jgi:chemotaxis protein MotC
MALARQYLARFPKSPFAGNFLKSFTATLIRLHLAEEIDNFPKLESIAETLSRDEQRGLFLTIARAALVAGRIAMADVAASKALTIAQPDSPDEARGKLYQAAARVLTDQRESGIAQLHAIDPRKLPKRDETLLTAARTLAQGVYEKTATAPESAPPGPDDSVSATIRLAEAALLKAQQPTSAEAP